MLRRPVAVILIVSAITLCFAWHIPRLSFRTSFYDLLIEELPESARYETFKEIFGSDEMIRVVIKGTNIFDPVTFREIERFAAAVAKINGITRVISLPGIKKDVDIAGKWSLEKFAAVVAPVELFRRNLISDDLKTTAVTLVLESGADKDRVIGRIRELILKMPGGLSVYQIGMPLVSQAIARFTEKDFFRIPPITFLLIGCMLFFLFRNLSCVILPLVCVVLSLIWTLGLMALTGIQLSILTMIVPVFLIAVGTAYCLYIGSAYTADAKHADTPEPAVFATFSNIAFPTVLAVFTTIVGLGSLLVNRIVAIREFAIFAGFGMISLLIIVLTFFPSALVLMPLPGAKNSRNAEEHHLLTSLLDGVIRLVLHHQRMTFSVCGILVICCAAGLFRIKVETNPLDYFKRDTAVYRNFHDIYRDLSGSFPINVVMTGSEDDYFEDPGHIADIARLQAFVETLPGVDKTVSFADYLKLVNYAMNRFDPKYYVLPHEGWELRMVMNNYKSMLGDDMFYRFMNPELSTANILLLTHISSSRDFLQIREQIRTHVQQHFPENLRWEVTGFGMVISASSHLLVSGQVKSLSITVVLVFIIMLALFLSGKVGLVAIFTSLFPIIINFGIMGWLGIELSMATSLIASIAIGLAVDDTIHYLVKYNREFKKDLDKDRALHDTIKRVGKPIIFTTLTISLGFSILIFSHFKLTAVFGLLMVITMLSALVGDLILLPSLMLHIELVTAWDMLRLMPAPGGMPAGIVHELNQPLNAIKMGGEFLKMMIQRGDTLQPEQLMQVVSEINDQVDRASEIINRLQPFGRKPGFEKEAVDINQPIRDTLAIVGHQLHLENISVNLELDETLPSVLAHGNRLGQVIYNLVDNACDAIIEKRKKTGQTGEAVITIRTFRENDRVGISIADSGIGIPAHMIDRITEPFFTTKQTGKGKGLGLSISNEIVRGYGGRLDVRSEKGAGATFTLTFPPSASLESMKRKVR